MNDWIKGFDIDDYIDLLHNAHKRDCDNDITKMTIYYSTHGFIPLYLIKLKRGNNTEILKYCKAVVHESTGDTFKLHLMDKWIIPININDNHWILIVTLIKSNHICIYDSLYNFDKRNSMSLSL